MITREQSLDFLDRQIENKNIIKHMLATEAVMRVLAKKFDPEKEEEWARAGLLHDGDYRDDVPHDQQGIKVSQMLEEEGYEVPDSVKRAMAAHNWENTGVAPQTKMGWSLFICDSLTGLIVATALVRPDKKLASVDVESVLKKFRQLSFAAGTRRKDIELCEEKLGIPLEKFVGIVLGAMQGISKDLGL